MRDLWLRAASFGAWGAAFTYFRYLMSRTETRARYTIADLRQQTEGIRAGVASLSRGAVGCYLGAAIHQLP